jgi:hypothetical protein
MARQPRGTPDELAQPRAVDGAATADAQASSPSGTSDNPYIVALARSDDPALERHEVLLWEVIDRTTKATSFDLYARYLNALFDNPSFSETDQTGRIWKYKRNSSVRRFVSPYGLDAWDLVTEATDIFLKHQAGALSDVDYLARHSANVLEDDDYLATHPTIKDSGLPNLETEVSTDRQQWELALATELGRRNPRLQTYLERVRINLAELPLLAAPRFSSDRESGIFVDRIQSPLLIELIWSYWMEQGMLVQTMNAIALRFQNAEVAELVDPLRNLAIDPLRPLANMLWSFVQNEGNRLSVARRAHEYLHAYGLELAGKAVPTSRAVERRTRFLESFHNLLHATSVFFKQHDDLTVKADGFPLLKAIAEVHLLLAEGAHNQFGDLPWTARSEMMSMQWLLARSEFREFLGGRIMLPYPEPWMDRVDTMKTLQGWSDVSITSFYWLAVYGEQLLLSIRYGNWSLISDGALAAKWAEKWRPAVHSYIHHYRQVTGVDLTIPPVEGRDPTERFVQPSVLIARRIAQMQQPGSAPQLAAPVRRSLMPNQIGLPRRPAITSGRPN